MSGRRFEEAGLRGMTQVWNGRAQGKHRGCSAVEASGPAESTGAVRRWEAPGSAESTGAVRRYRLVVVRGDTSAAFAVMPGVVCGDSRQCSR